MGRSFKPLDPGRRRIDLDHILAGTVADVLYANAYLDGIAPLLFQTGITPLERSIGKTESERKVHCLAKGVEIPVSHPDILFIYGIAEIAGLFERLAAERLYVIPVKYIMYREIL